MRVTEVLASEFRGGAKLLLDTQNLVILGQTFRTAGRSSLNLTGRETNDQVGDKRILCLSGTMRNHRTPAITLSELVRINGFGYTTDLIDF